jgi:hypothetical protein
LKSGKVTRLPIGWDLEYFSADQKTAVFEHPPFYYDEYRPWAALDMATGRETKKVPYPTDGLWAISLSQSYPSAGVTPDFSESSDVWVLHSPQTPSRLLHPMPGRGYADDHFAGLSVDGVIHPMNLPLSLARYCGDAQVTGDMAALETAPDGGNVFYLWMTSLRLDAKPILVATNCTFEILGERDCVLLNSRETPLPEALVYDGQSQGKWNVFEGVPEWLKIIDAFDGVADEHGFYGGPKPATAITNKPSFESGIGRICGVHLIPGSGAPPFPAMVMCECSCYVPGRLQTKLFVLINARGERYQINLPDNLQNRAFENPWLDNSGKLVFKQYDQSPGTSCLKHVRITVADLQMEK